MTPDVRDRLDEQTPLGRLGTPADTAALVSFLCSEDGGWVTGQVLASNGGF
jgi:3-oxoacyl-[acyl-carrier protein] reductase